MTSWEEQAIQHWVWRAGHAGGRIAQPLSSLIRSPTDLAPFLAQMRKAREPIPQIFLDTRPSYMSKEGPPVLISRQTYYAMFEQLLERVPGVASLTPQELDALFAPYSDLPELVAAAPTLKRNVLWAATLRRRNASWHFRATIQPELLAAVYHPRRIECLLDTYGMEALDSLG